MVLKHLHGGNVSQVLITLILLELKVISLPPVYCRPACTSMLSDLQGSGQTGLALNWWQRLITFGSSSIRNKNNQANLMKYYSYQYYSMWTLFFSGLKSVNLKEKKESFSHFALKLIDS